MNLIVNQINHELTKEGNFIINLKQEWLNNNNVLMCSTHNEGKKLINADYSVLTKKNETS